MSTYVWIYVWEGGKRYVLLSFEQSLVIDLCTKVLKLICSKDFIFHVQTLETDTAGQADTRIFEHAKVIRHIAPSSQSYIHICNIWFSIWMDMCFRMCKYPRPYLSNALLFLWTATNCCMPTKTNLSLFFSGPPSHCFKWPHTAASNSRKKIDTKT